MDLSPMSYGCLVNQLILATMKLLEKYKQTLSKLLMTSFLVLNVPVQTTKNNLFKDLLGIIKNFFRTSFHWWDYAKTPKRFVVVFIGYICAVEKRPLF